MSFFSFLSLSTCTFVIYSTSLAQCSGTPILLPLLSSTYPLLLAPALGSGRWRSSLCIVGKKQHYLSDADFPSCWWSGPLVVFATKWKWNSLVSVPVQRGSLFLLRPTLTVTKPRSMYVLRWVINPTCWVLESETQGTFSIASMCFSIKRVLPLKLAFLEACEQRVWKNDHSFSKELHEVCIKFTCHWPWAVIGGLSLGSTSASFFPEDAIVRNSVV